MARKEGWQEEDWQQKSSQGEKPRPIIIPPEILQITKPEISKEGIDHLLTCVCLKKTRLVGIEDQMVKFRCGCGTEYAYPDGHPYFIVPKEAPMGILPKEHPRDIPNKEPPKEPPNAETVPIPVPTQPVQPPTNYTCTDCLTKITMTQALSSYEFIGRKLCEDCLGDELA